MTTQLKEIIQSRMAELGANPSAVALKAGLSRSAVRDIMSGKSKSPSVDTLKAIATALECQVSDLLGAGEPSKAGVSVSSLRKAKGLTQAQLAEKLGVHWITVSKLERGVIQITERKAEEIAKALDADPSQIWGVKASESEVTIVAAAILHGAVISLPAPARHHTILQSMDLEMGIDPTSVPPANQGFLTSEGKFVNRVEAYYIAHRAGQIGAKDGTPRLFSEDLW